MGFVEQRFPTDIDWGAQGGPGWMTEIISLDSGIESRVPRWEQARHKYKVDFSNREYADLAAVRDFYNAVGGARHGFRFRDWIDCCTTRDGRAPADSPIDGWAEAPSVSDTDQVLGTGNGTDVDFQLVKKYDIEGSGDPSSFTRPLTKIVASTTVISLDDVPTPSGWTVNVNTGIVTFTSPPAMGVEIKGGCEFDVPVRFDESTDGWFDVTLDTFGAGNVEIGLVEILESVTPRPDFNPGGAGEFDISSGNVLLAITDALYQEGDGHATNYLRLPDETNLPLGGPYFWIENTHGSTGLIVYDYAEAVLVTTIPAGEVGGFFLTASGWSVV